jgi:hypothetical protein
MDEPNHEEVKHDPLAGCLLRLFWMIVGNALLAFCAVSIVGGPSRLLGLEDAFYWALVGCLLAVRYVDIQYFNGQTADGDTASMADWRRYVVRVGVVSAGLWLVAHAIGASGLLSLAS